MKSERESNLFLSRTNVELLLNQKKERNDVRLCVCADCVDGIDAQKVLGYALYKDGKSTKIPYPLDKFESDVAGRSFHNGRFIQRMRQKAASLP